MGRVKIIFLLLSAFCLSMGRTNAQSTLKEAMKLLEDKYDVSFVYNSALDTESAFKGQEPAWSDLGKDLERIFSNSGIEWKKRGKYIILTPKKTRTEVEEENEERPSRNMLPEAIVISDKNIVSRTQTGYTAIDGARINKGYAALSSPDLIKVLQSYTGVQTGTEMLAGFYVHGGTGRDNLFLLDGVPIYQVNHLAGLFSSFNTDMIRSVDFYKSGFPARYGGRLSSVVDVSLREGDFNEYHGSFSIGLLDGRFQYEGPIVKDRTSFNIALRRSWLDLMSVPAVAVVNSLSEDRYGFSYSFHDFNAKLVHRISQGNKLTFNLFSGRDGFSFSQTKKGLKTVEESQIGLSETHTGENVNDMGMKWGNFMTSVSWDIRPGDGLNARFIGYYTRTRSWLDYVRDSWDWKQDTEDYHSLVENDSYLTLHDISAKADFVYPCGRHILRFGGQYLFHIYDPEQTYSLAGIADVGESFSDTQSFATRYLAHEPSLYAEDEMHLLDWFDLTLGLRGTLFASDGKIWKGLEPRVSASIRFSDRIALKASYVEMNQYSHGIASTSLDLPTNFWLPSTGKIKPMHSRQYAAELAARLPSGIRLELGGFYRTLDHVYEYSGINLFFPSMAKWETDFVEGEGIAYGAEAALGWSGTKVDVNLGYTLSWSKRYFEEFHYDWYYDRSDSRHKLTADLSYRINDRIDLYAAWNYHTGPWATSYAHYLSPDDEIEVFPNTFYTGPSNLRLPAYHRLDVGANFRRTTRRGREAVWNVSLYNAYCRMNPIFVVDYSEDKAGNPILKAASAFPVIPSFSYTLKF